MNKSAIESIEKMISTELKSDFEDLQKVRDFCLSAFAAFRPDCGDESDEIINAQLALNEAVANVMEHAYKGETGHPISLSATATESNLIFEILHDGLEFEEPTEIDAIEMPQEGGMGLFLIQQCVDETWYGQRDGRQCIRFTFHY